MRAIVRHSILSATLLAGAAGATVSFSACSSTNGAQGDSPTTAAPAVGSGTTPASGVGSMGMQLTVPGGLQLANVAWTITGPNGGAAVVQSGTVNVQNSQGINFVVGGIPAASGYTVTLSSTSTDGASACGGSATFNVAARATTSVSVQLQCTTAPSDSGSALITGNTVNCATWNSVSAIPSATTVGSSVTVSASAIAPNPGAITYAWSAPSGTFSAPSAASTSFTCTAPGAVTLTLSLTDGPVGDSGACNPTLTTATVQVNCTGHLDAAQALPTATKIKHLVVIFNENISYDHYFGTYPYAQNNAGETPFEPLPGTPTGNSLSTPLDPTRSFAPITTENLLTANPVAANALNAAGATNPFRLGPSQAATADQGHNYLPEQEADDNGAMDLFPRYTGTAGPPPDAGAVAATTGLVMAYYDGNTLGTFWGLAQQYAMNDNSWTTVFGPSTPGAINLVSGQTNGISATNHLPLSASHAVADGNGGLSLIGDADPLGDICSTAADQVTFAGKNVGDLLNAGGVTWGWFEGGFNLSVTNANGTTGCNRSTPPTVGGSTSADYIPHHAPFQYYASTANPTHARPTSTSAIGSTDVANHEYDSADFFAALSAGNLPAVVYLKAPAFQDGHPGYSNPTDEQSFVTQVVTALQNAQEWSSTAIVVSYDDSDGWYDHQEPPILNPSSSAADALNGAGKCTSGAQQSGAAPTMPLLGAVPADGGAAQPAQGRCGYGTRIPLMVISPFAKRNFIDHTLTDQTSVLRFVEDNWLGGQRIQPGGSFDTVAGPITNMLSGI
jgi:phospholipase C